MTTAQAILRDLEPRQGDTVGDILTDLLIELRKADEKYGPMPEIVAGLFTIRCELEELTREVLRKTHIPQHIRAEAIQVGAMAIKFLRDCCKE